MIHNVAVKNKIITNNHQFVFIMSLCVQENAKEKKEEEKENLKIILVIAELIQKNTRQDTNS